jgi:hypothetical protein
MDMDPSYIPALIKSVETIWTLHIMSPKGNEQGDHNSMFIIRWWVANEG